MRLCIVTPSPPGVSETFIRAHLENLPYEIVHLHDPGGNPTCKDRRLRELYARKRPARWLNILPRFVEFRLRKSYCHEPTEVELLVNFLQQQRIDVVLAEYGTTAALICPACQNAGIPLVAHFHGYDASRYDVMESFADRYHHMFRYSSAVISVSEAMSQALLAMGCSPQKIHLNPYGPASMFFEVEPNYDSNWLLAVGRLTGKKAPYLTLDAFRRAHQITPHLKLRLIGSGELNEVCQRLIDAWDLGDHVEMIEMATPTQVAAYMAQSFAFVQHSITASNGDQEGTPVAILEAGAAGLPVISTRHAGIPDVVMDCETGYLVESGDSLAMANCITQIARDRLKARLLGKSARERIKGDFSIERHLDQLIKLIDCVGSNKSS